MTRSELRVIQGVQCSLYMIIIILYNVYTVHCTIYRALDTLELSLIILYGILDFWVPDSKEFCSCIKISGGKYLNIFSYNIMGAQTKAIVSSKLRYFHDTIRQNRMPIYAKMGFTQLDITGLSIFCKKSQRRQKAFS